MDNLREDFRNWLVGQGILCSVSFINNYNNVVSF